MTFLRSRDLVFWVLVVAALAGLAFISATRGASPAPGGKSQAVVAAPAPSGSQAVATVRELLALMPSGVAAGSQLSSLVSWSDAVATQATAGAQLRKAEGAPAGDQMLTGFERVRADAERVRTHAGDPVSATAARTQVGLDVDNLHLISLGMPAPALPDEGLNPFNSGQALPPPQPALPNKPTMPTLPEKTK